MGYTMTNNIFLYVFLVLYIGALLTIGQIAKRKTKNMDDFVTARKSYPWWVLAPVLASTFASGSAFMGGAGQAYGIGFPAYWYFAGWPAAKFIGMCFQGKYVKALNRVGVRSIPEYIGKRFRSNALRLIVGIANFGMLFLVAGQLTSIGTIFEVTFGLNYRVGLAVGILVIMSYILVGGAHADFMTGFMQGIIMLIASFICGGLFIYKVVTMGGLAEFTAAISTALPQGGPDTVFSDVSGQYSSLFPALMCMASHCIYTFMPHSGIKMAALDKTKDFPKFTYACALYCFAFSCLTPLTGFVAKLDLPNLSRNDMANPAYFSTLQPILGAFLIIALFCSILSTAAGMYVSLSQVIANDFYKETFAPKWNHSEVMVEKNVKIITRISMVALAIIGLVMVWNPPSFITMLVWAGIGALVATCLASLFVGTLWYGVTKTAAILSAIIGLSTYLFVTLVLGWTGMTGSGFCVMICIAVVLIFSKLTKDAPSHEYLHEVGFISDKEYAKIATKS